MWLRYSIASIMIHQAEPENYFKMVHLVSDLNSCNLAEKYSSDHTLRQSGIDKTDH